MKKDQCPETYATSKNTSVKQKPACKNPYIKLDHRIKEAPALSRTTIAIYEALLWHRREKNCCWPGYEKIGKRAKVKSKTTISLHLKVLRKVGLTVTKRRGFKQTNINYPLRATELTDEVTQKLQRKHQYIIEEINKETKQATRLRLAKREMRRKKFNRSRSQNIAAKQSYPQINEVQLLDSKKEALQASSRYSSNYHNDSKIENGEEKRGGGFTSISAYIPAALKHVARGAGGDLANPQPPAGDNLPSQKFPPLKTHLQSITQYSKIRGVVLKISTDIRDARHSAENASQAINIFKKIRERIGIGEDAFVQALWSARGLTLEIIHLLDRPGAYFFALLRDRWKIYLSSA